MEDGARFAPETLARELNQRQLEAVLYPARPLLVVAGAGSGKTRVITYRLARLLAMGEDPRSVFAVTFTNKAAGEMRGRVAALLGAAPAEVGRLWLGTFHALSARLLRRYGPEVGLKSDFVIYDQNDQRRLLARVLSDLGVQERLYPARHVAVIIDAAKNQGQGPAEFVPSDYHGDVVAKAYGAYEERLHAAGAVDFGGLLLWALRLFAPGGPADELAGRFRHVLVDEFQDTNSVQYRLVRLLSTCTGSITVVGDEDQSIYSWRGADIRNILDFERDHPGAGVVKLEQNYRSTAKILQAANAVIAGNKERRPKTLFTASERGDPIVLYEGETERDEADFVVSTIAAALDRGSTPREIAVFYRTNAQSRVIEDALRNHDLPYVVVGGTRFFDRAEVKDLIAYLRVIFNPDDAVGLLRIVNVPARGIGDATLERVAALARERGFGLSRALAAAASDAGVLGAGPRKKVAAFVALLSGLRRDAAALSPSALAARVLELSGTKAALRAEASLEAEGRLENLEELVALVREYENESPEPTLAGFLERVALVADADEYDPGRGAISLMTVHTAKGLEFPIVFVTGLEDGLFPHARNLDDSAIEEERRLCYVAVTRAMRRLYLSRVRSRRLSGRLLGSGPSRFLRDLPPDCYERRVMPQPAYLRLDTEKHGPRSRGNIHLHYDGGEEEGELRIGSRLYHPWFGAGVVRNVHGMGKDVKVTMRFPEFGEKTILAKFLRRE